MADNKEGGRSLYATSDGGATWRRVSGPQDYFGWEMSFVSPTSGFINVPAVKLRPWELLKTTDGGVTWTQVPTTVT